MLIMIIGGSFLRAMSSDRRRQRRRRWRRRRIQCRRIGLGRYPINGSGGGTPGHPCGILVASDAIGMGLNLNIKRVIFTAMHKFDGEQISDIDVLILSH